jgi:hypothetical protein
MPDPATRAEAVTSQDVKNTALLIPCVSISDLIVLQISTIDVIRIPQLFSIDEAQSRTLMTIPVQICPTHWGHARRSPQNFPSQEYIRYCER